MRINIFRVSLNGFVRTFVAIDIPNVEKIVHFQNTVMKQFKFDKYHINPIPKDNIHLTIKFLGEINEVEVEAIIANLSQLYFESFEIRFINAGCFPNSSYPRVIWLGLDKQSTEKLNNLYDLITKLLDRVNGYKNRLQNHVGREKSAFVPHLTIFRPNRHFQIYKSLDLNILNVFFNDEIRQIKLKKSILSSKGSIYSDIFTVNAVERNEEFKHQ